MTSLILSGFEFNLFPHKIVEDNSHPKKRTTQSPLLFNSFISKLRQHQKVILNKMNRHTFHIPRVAIFIGWLEIISVFAQV